MLGEVAPALRLLLPRLAVFPAVCGTFFKQHRAHVGPSQIQFSHSDDGLKRSNARREAGLLNIQDRLSVKTGTLGKL